MSTTATLNIVERAFLAADIVDALTDLGLTVASASFNTYMPGIAVQVANEDEVDRGATEFELGHDDGSVAGNYTRQGNVRGTDLRIYSARRLRVVHRCPACDHTADEPRRVESDAAVLGFEAEEAHEVTVVEPWTGGAGQWVDEHGYDRTPGQWPSPVWGM